VKQIPAKTTPNTRERSERSDSMTMENTALNASFFFHPVTQIYGFTHLLSSFTHTHVYASACAYRRTCMRGVEKEERKLWSPNTYPRRRQGWPTFASLRVSGLRWPSTGAERHTWPHVGSWCVCHCGRPNRYFRVICNRRRVREQSPSVRQFYFLVRTNKGDRLCQRNQNSNVIDGTR
jgi:hypothetical protein